MPAWWVEVILVVEWGDGGRGNKKEKKKEKKSKQQWHMKVVTLKIFNTMNINWETVQ